MAWGMTHNFRDAERHMASLRKQVRFAQAGAINDVLFAALKEEQAGMRAAFDRPTPFVVNSVRVEQAKREKLEGTLFVPTQAAGDATLPAGKPLLAEVFGGPRRLKRSEKLLQAKGILPRGMYAVPGPAAEIDAYGNMTSRQIKQILAYFQVYGDVARSGKHMRSNITTEGRARFKRGVPRARTGGFGIEYFVVPPGTKGLRAGIYLRQLSTKRVSVLQRRSVRAVLFFVSAATYTRALAFHAIARRTVAAQYMERFNQRLAYALATARL